MSFLNPYADDTQLDISIPASEFSICVSHFVISLNYLWISSKFLLLTPDKTEFLVIAQPQQLAKLCHATIT